MQLFYSTTSPFARKVNIFLRLTGLINTTELVSTNFESEELRKLNPLGKIPALKDGELVLPDSTLICQYLDEQYVALGNDSLFHNGEEDYYQVQMAHTLANGILEAAVSTVMEKRRDTEHSIYWLGRWRAAMHTAIKNIDFEAITNGDNPNIATITTAAALGYLDFRLSSEHDWRKWNADLAGWFESIRFEDWFVDTTPTQA
ncbi:glutathione S-transferase [Alteromonadaceae bacterium Bs31]|nr:glutathione S-transferase [Alteromonadaceae bacterium Bs31]